MLDESGVTELNGCSHWLFRYLKMIIFETADPRGFLFMERRCSTEAKTPPGSARPKREGIGEEHEPSELAAPTSEAEPTGSILCQPSERAVGTWASFWMEPPDRTLAPGAQGGRSCQGHLAETLGGLLPQGRPFPPSCSGSALWGSRRAHPGWELLCHDTEEPFGQKRRNTFAVLKPPGVL